MPKIDPFEHVKDSNHISTFETIGWGINLPGAEDLPSWLRVVFPYGITKFMILELFAFGLVLWFVLPVVRRLRTGEPPHGWWANAVEGLLLFIRDEVARPAIPDDHGHGHGHGEAGHAPTKHRADIYLPLLWTQFLFILFCNLLGMLPFSGSPTASLAVTSALALISFIVIHGSGVFYNGVAGYAKSFVPPAEEATGFMKYLTPMIRAGVAGMEVFSGFIRSIVLALRLFANMLAGHTALFVLLLFIQLVGTSMSPTAPYLFWPITLMSTTMVIALSMLELFVAVLQAYVFMMLTATFIGLAVAPSH
jgi:F-type H+-transporting ATPase subunit a